LYRGRKKRVTRLFKEKKGRVITGFGKGGSSPEAEEEKKEHNLGGGKKDIQSPTV